MYVTPSWGTYLNSTEELMSLVLCQCDFLDPKDAQLMC